MSRIALNRFPHGLQKALTFSYDDGTVHDRTLVEIFNTHGVRGTFHLNSGLLDKPNKLTSREIATLFKGHEVSAHTVTHPDLRVQPAESITREILDDRRALEDWVGYPVRGMSYPFGTCNDLVVSLLPGLGIEYARTTEAHRRFELPADFLRWGSTCHHKGDLLDLGKRFLDAKGMRTPQLLYVWGHSYEFDRENNWDLMREFCAMVGRNESVWYATNIEIVDYLNAVRTLRFSAAVDRVLNPSAWPVWISVEDRPLEIPAGACIPLNMPA
jgi:peptidoglycan/xylan/chitin deacetylase (PgdA/CDA1 family)